MSPRVGNLTDDGVYQYRYNAFGQAVEIRRRAGAETSVATFTYDPIGRLIQSAVSHSGENQLDQDARARPDGGNRTLDYFYDGGRLLEVHNAFPATIAQHLYGPSGCDPIATDVNGDPKNCGDADPDKIVTDDGDENSDAVPDMRFFYHKDAAGRLAAISGYTEATGKGGSDGAVWSRVVHTPTGVLYLNNDDNGQELNAPDTQPPADQLLGDLCGWPLEPVPDIPKLPMPGPGPRNDCYNTYCVDGSKPIRNAATGQCECGGSWGGGDGGPGTGGSGTGGTGTGGPGRGPIGEPPWEPPGRGRGGPGPVGGPWPGSCGPGGCGGPGPEVIFNDPATTQPIPKAPIVPPNFPPSKDPCPQSLDDIAARHADFKVLLDQMKKMKNCPMPEVICASCDSADPRYKTGGVYFDPPAGLNKRGGLMILCSGVWNDEIAFHELRHMLQYCKQANGQSPFIPGVIRTSPVNGVSDNCMKHAGREFDAYYYTSCRSFASPSDRCECAMNGCKGSAIGACKNLLDNPTAQANAESACEAVKKEYEQKDCANSGVLALV